MARRFLRIVCAFGMIAVIGCGDDSTTRETSVALDQVTNEVRTIVDQTRPTMANGSFVGADERSIETHLWYAEAALARPACRGERCALIILAHGFGGNPARFDAIGRRLAAAGYIVAAVRFPLTNEAAPGGFISAFGDLVNQPADLSRVLDALLEADAHTADPLYRRIDADRVALLGHSLGGATVIASTRLTCCSDPRIDANILVAPLTAVSGAFGEEVSTDAFPTLIIQGSEDPILPPRQVAAFREAIDAPKVYVELDGGGHVLVIEATETRFSPLLDRSAEVSVAFLDRYLSGEGDEELELVAGRLRDEGHIVDLNLN